MDIIKWRASYETGVEQMDAQHKQLIDLINTMYRVMRNMEDADAVDGVINAMLNYAERHFRDEEIFLRTSYYPHLDQHASLHQEYRLQMEKFMEEYEKNPREVTKEIYAFLRKWWLEHIVREDKLYGTVVGE